MYERCLNEAERILATDKDVIVAVKKVWLDVRREGTSQGFDVPNLPDFTAMLEGDLRFEFLPAHQSLKDDLEDPIPSVTPEETEMEQMGFFSGDRIKLRSVELTPQLLGTIIRSKVDRTMDALTKAWDMRPEGDLATEDRLLEILAKTQKLQKEVKRTFSSDRMKKLGSSLQGRSKPSKRKTSSRKRASAKKTVTRKKQVRRSAGRPAKRRSS